MDTTLEKKFFSYYFCDDTYSRCKGLPTALDYADSMAILSNAGHEDVRMAGLMCLSNIEEVSKAINEFDKTFGLHQQILEIVEEVRNNLISLNTEREKECYLFRILRVFGGADKLSYCGFVFPDEINQQLGITKPNSNYEEMDITIRKYFGLSKHEKYVAYALEDCLFPDNEAKNLLCGAISEYLLQAEAFISLLDGMLMEQNINLLDLEAKSGFYILGKDIKTEERIYNASSYFGSKQLTRYYYNALPKLTSTIFRKDAKQEEKEVTRVDARKNSELAKVKGRPRAKAFSRFLNDTQKEVRLKALHNLLKGCKGKQVVIYLKACIDLGWLKEKPTFTPVKNEFGDIGNSSGFNKYMGQTFDSVELSTAKSALKDALASINS